MQLSQAERNAAAGSGSAPKSGWGAMVPELDVTDIGTSLDFWCNLLGFTVAYDRRRRSSPIWSARARR
jgi:hypothetical protein